MGRYLAGGGHQAFKKHGSGKKTLERTALNGAVKMWIALRFIETGVSSQSKWDRSSNTIK
jgi:hypothetical protein